MPVTTSQDKPDVARIVGWSVFLPILCVWPFLSAMPLFTLLGGPLSTLAVSINVALLLFGFWPIAALAVAYVVLRTGPAVDRRSVIGERGLLLGAYASLWTVLYLVVAFASP